MHIGRAIDSYDGRYLNNRTCLRRPSHISRHSATQLDAIETMTMHPAAHLDRMTRGGEVMARYEGRDISCNGQWVTDAVSEDI